MRIKRYLVLLVENGFNRFFWTVDDAYVFNNSNLILRSLDNIFELDFTNLIEYYLDGTPVPLM